MMMFLIISRTLTEDIIKRVQSLVNAGIDAYAIIDKGLEKSTKRFITYDNDELEQAGYMQLNMSHPLLNQVYKVTGWDKAVYHLHKTKANYAWICEDDVYWNRPAVIKMILEKTNSVKDDLIAYPLARSVKETPDWYHWKKLPEITSDKSKWIGTYNQLCRLSSRLVDKIDKFARRNKSLLLHEAVFPTLCKINNYKISYYNEYDLPIFFHIIWNPPLTEEKVNAIVSQHSYVLLHPVKTEEVLKMKQNEQSVFSRRK